MDSDAITEELPEYQIFHVLRHGEQEPIGPYSQNQLVDLLNNGQMHASDLIYYPELPGWTPFSQVFEQHQKITNHGEEGQDAHLVAQTFAFVDNISEPHEEIYYIAIQHFPALGLTGSVKLRSPKSVILTNWRFCVLKPKLLGSPEFTEFLLSDIESAEVLLEAGHSLGSFEIIPRFGDSVEVDHLPAAQLERLGQISSELLSDPTIKS